MFGNLIPGQGNSLGMRRVDADGTVHDWEEIGKETVSSSMVDSMFQNGVTMFKFDSDDRALLVLAADKLGTSVSFLLATLRQILDSLKELEKKVPKGKKVDGKWLKIQPRYDPTIDPLPNVRQLLGVERCEVPERVGTIIKRYNELAIEAMRLAGNPAEPPIRIPDYAENPFLKVKPVLFDGVNLNITSDIHALIIEEYKNRWFKGPERSCLDHLFKTEIASSITSQFSTLKVQSLMKLLQDMANVMYGWNDKELDNLPLKESLQELIMIGAVDKNLPPPHLTQLGTFIRHVILSTNPGHLRLLRRLKTRS
jgi:hypothetical protein